MVMRTSYEAAVFFSLLPLPHILLSTLFSYSPFLPRTHTKQQVFVSHWDGKLSSGC